MTLLSALALLGWIVLLFLPWQPWRNRELIAARADRDHDLNDISVLIPARTEAASLPHSLRALGAQGRGLDVLVVDDGSSDGTAEAASMNGARVIAARPLPEGWSGKVWAQAEGAGHLQRPLLLLLDADIQLAPGMLATLRARLEEERLDLVSVMASLPVRGHWERLLAPAFIYCFKLLYPFALSNRPDSAVAAAAGGCILLRRDALDAIGGFRALADALIDDCTLARLIKRHGGRLWIGQSLDVTSLRGYPRLRDVWDTVARTAYTQLERSASKLVLASALLGLMFAVPLASLAVGAPLAKLFGALAMLAMTVSYLPTVLLYAVPVGWVLTLPVAAALYLLMTWSSALRHLRGETARWRGRRYGDGAARLR